MYCDELLLCAAMTTARHTYRLVIRTGPYMAEEIALLVAGNAASTFTLPLSWQEVKSRFGCAYASVEACRAVEPVHSRVGGGGTAVAVGDRSVAADPHAPIRVIRLKRMTVLKIGLDIGSLLSLVIGACPIDISVDHSRRKPARYRPAKRPP